MNPQVQGWFVSITFGILSAPLARVERHQNQVEALLAILHAFLNVLSVDGCLKSIHLFTMIYYPSI